MPSRPLITEEPDGSGRAYELEAIVRTTPWLMRALAVAVPLEADDALTIVAPCGLDDLLDLVQRRNPRRVTVEEYERRLAAKRIAERWPRVTIVPAR